MSAVVFDIETLGFPAESFDEVQQRYLFRDADTPEKLEAEVQKLNLSALTAQIIAIGMVNPESMAGQVLYQADSGERSSADGVDYLAGDETFILRSFWDAVRRYDRFITFNGRGFDCPFIMLRSAIHGIRPTRNLVPYRYEAKIHCDLLDQLTFYGATRRFNLDFYCKAFGIKSPKSEGVTGLDLGPLFRERRFMEIARYCLGDVVATAELYRRWDAFLNIRD